MDSTSEQLFFIDKTQHSGEEYNFAEGLDVTDLANDERSGDGVILGEDEEELELERLVFGANPEKLFDEEHQKDELQDYAEDSLKDQYQKEGYLSSTEILLVSGKRKPAWVDEDDKNLNIDIKHNKRLRKLRTAEEDDIINGENFENRLRSQFEKIVGAPKWADMDKRREESDEEDNFLQSTKQYLGKSTSLPPSLIEIRRVKDANSVKKSNSSIKCIEFHPASKAILTAGLNNTLDIFQVDNETNPKIQTIFLKGFPIHSAHFTTDGEEIILSSRRKYFHSFDLTTGEITKIPQIKGRNEKSLEEFITSPDGSCIAFLGESGYINLVSVKSKQLISSLKMNGSVKAVAFSNDGSHLFSFGGDGEVYIWDMKSKRCKHKFRDEGCLKGTCIDVSKDGRFVACGSNSGVVNIYNEKCFVERNPKPIKTVLNLTTSIHILAFNPTSEMLAISSRAMKDSLKLLHIPTLTVFSNWPTKKITFGYIQSLCFSPQSGYLAVGSDTGRALLFRTRLFILTPRDLSYHDGSSIEKKGKQKGCIELSKIKLVEQVDDGALEKKFCFQIQHGELTLYIIATSDEERNEWITSLRYEISQQNRLLLENFHSGVYSNGCWTCCKEKARHKQGCQKTYFASQIDGVTKQQNAKPYTNRQEMPLPPIPGDEKVNGSKEDSFKVIAIYDFSAMQPADLSLVKDHEYIIFDKSQPHWWKARDMQGNEGFIPSNYVRQEIGLEGQKWFHGDMSRQEADEVLKAEEKDGVFLVRNSSRPEMYTLSLSFQGVIKHYHIKMTEVKKYFVSQRHTFDSIMKLVEYHQLNSAGLTTRLRFPYTNQGDCPSTPELGHGIFEIDRDEISFGRQLGSGQFGTVYEGTWKGNRNIAIKMMKEGTMSEDDFIEEAKAMSKFYHKNLVKLYGVCSKFRPIYIVTELMSNGSLLVYLRNNRMLLDKANILTSIIFQVVCAMKYLEEELFIHRDLAARNCLVGERNVVKVADFGLARYVLDDEYTASEGTKFPIKWAAPEVIQFTRFSSKSDVWAYGILCWEVFSGGKTPYPAMENIIVADEIMKGYRMDKPAKCPHNIYEIMTSCWEDEADSRPSFKELFAQLELLIEDYTDT
eukprot:gene7313-8130_t